MPPAARVTDLHTCPMVTGVVPHVGGPILPPGCKTVLIGGMPAARVGDKATCVGPPDTIAKGSASVMIGGMPAARLGDQTGHGGVVVVGCPTVMIGDSGSGGGGGGGVGGAKSVLLTDSNGNPLFTPQGEPSPVDPDRAGPAELQKGYLATKDGRAIVAYKNTSSNMAWNCDCHGYSIAQGKYWINNDDMQNFLDSEAASNSPIIAPVSTPSAGDIAVYRDADGNVVHSAVVTSPGEVTMAAGTVIYDGPDGPSKTTTVPVAQGWPQEGTQIQYYQIK